MVTIDSGIGFDFPPTWEKFAEGSRLIFHTPRREEIIMTAQRLVGGGEIGEREKRLEQMLATSLAAAQKNAAAPELRIVKPLTKDVAPSAFRCWTVSAESTAHGIFFGQVIIQHPQGIVFVTYEAPFISGAAELFHNLLEMIQKI